jgi:hypothetical protein
MRIVNPTHFGQRFGKHRDEYSLAAGKHLRRLS